LAAIFDEERRIGRRPGEMWPDSTEKLDTDQYIALLKTVPAGTGLTGYLATLAALDRRPPRTPPPE
jgi:hypothetical protein